MGERTGLGRLTAWAVALVVGMMVALGVAWTPPALAAGALIIDHRHTDLADVPLEWIEAAKDKLHIAYGHTSHGSQIVTGMTGLTGFANAPHGGSTYAWNDGGRDGALDLADTPFSGASDLGNPDFKAWAAATRRYLADPANADVNVVMWSWCGQVSYATAANITTYLDLMSGLEKDYPNVRFVYMTGHTDGSGLTGNLHVRNRQIRDYCVANGKTLYDFEDIESYDPDGAYFGDKHVTDTCDYDGGNWAVEWQNAHKKGVDWYQCASAHSQPLNANLKAYAAWALWARLAQADVAPFKPKVTLRVSGLASGVLRLGTRFAAKGKVVPTTLAGQKVTLTLQRYRLGKWRTVTTAVRKIAGGGTWVWRHAPARRGTYRLRATVAKTLAHKAAASPWQRFLVR